MGDGGQADVLSRIQAAPINHADSLSPLPPPWHHLRALLLEIGRIEPIRGYDESYLSPFGLRQQQAAALAYFDVFWLCAAHGVVRLAARRA